MSVDVLYSTTATATGGRDGRAQTQDGSLDVKLSTPKELGGALITPQKSTAKQAYPAAPVSILTTIPAGMVKAAPLIVLILFIGGMFGILEETGALNAGVDRLVVATGGNVRIVVPAVMIVIACGSTFLGLISEYLVLIPMMVLLAERLGYTKTIGESKSCPVL